MNYTRSCATYFRRSRNSTGSFARIAKELAEAGALLKFNGQLLIEPDKFAQTAISIASRLASSGHK